MKKIAQLFLVTGFIITNFSCKHRMPKEIDDILNVVHKREKLPPVEHDEELASFVQEFVREAKKRDAVNIIQKAVPKEKIEQLLIIKYVDKLSHAANPNVLAACTRFKSESSHTQDLRWLRIEVHRERTKNYTKGSRILLRELMFHELFHCFYSKGHLPEEYPGIMNANFDENTKKRSEK